MKRMHHSRIVLILGLVFLVSFTAAEDIKQIRPTGYVTDLAGVIGAETKARLETLCAEVEQKTGAQMAIVTVGSLEGESGGNYAGDPCKQLGFASNKHNPRLFLLLPPTHQQTR